MSHFENAAATPTHSTLTPASRGELIELCRHSFSDAEGEAEGAQIGALVSALAAGIDDRDIVCFGSRLGGELIGAIFFTRLSYAEPVEVFVLGPVAIATSHQRKGAGTELISFGLQVLRNRGVSVAMTYGDPAYYTRLGFEPVSESRIAAPLPLSMPHGWLGQSLTDEELPLLTTRPRCVQAFDDPAYW